MICLRCSVQISGMRSDPRSFQGPLRPQAFMEVIAWNFTKELSKARSLSRESDGSLYETAATGDGLEGSLWLEGCH